MTRSRPTDGVRGRRAARIALRAALAMALPAALAAPTPAYAGDAEAGRALAERHCSRCHVIGDYNRMGGIESTPGFPLLLRMDDWEARFTSFFLRPPHPPFVRIEGAPPPGPDEPTTATITLRPDQLEDLMAWIAGQREPD